MNPWETAPPTDETPPWMTTPPGEEAAPVDKPSYRVDLKSDKAKATNQAEMVKRALYTPGTDFYDLPEAQKQQMLKQAELVAKEPRTKLRQSLKDDVLEVPRFLSEAGVATTNAMGRGLASAAGVVNGLGRAVMTGSMDEGLDQYKRTTDALKFKELQSPMAPSKTGEGFAGLAGMGTEAYGNLIGDQETAQKHSQALMDVLALSGLKGGIKYAKPAMELVTDTALRGVDKLPYMSDTALYSQALKPGTSLSKKGQAARARAVETGLQKEAVVSPSGNALGAKGINDVINDTFGDEGGLWQQGEKIVTGPEFKNARISLDTIQEGAKGTTSELAAGNKEAARSAVEKVVNELKEHPSYDPQTNTISAEGAYREKQKLYKNLQKAYEQDALTGIKDAQTEVAAQLRKTTGEVIPELKDVLAEEGENLNFIKYATRRMEKLSSEGAFHNSLGMVINAPKAIALRVFQSPGFKSRLAIAIRKAKNRAATPDEIQAVVDQVSAPFAEQTTYDNSTGRTIPAKMGENPVDRAITPDVQPVEPTTYDPSTGAQIPARGQGVPTGGAVENIPQAPGPKMVDRAVGGGEPSLQPDPMGGLDLKAEVTKAGGGKKGVADIAKQVGVPAAVLATWLLADEKKKKQLAMLPAFAGLVAYHGTSTGNLASIMKEGIRPNKVHGLGVAEFEGARGFADSSMNYAEGKPVVLRVELPDGSIDWMRYDGGSPKAEGIRNFNIGLKSGTHIPPEAIKDATIRGQVYEINPDGTLGANVGMRSHDYNTGTVSETMYRKKPQGGERLAGGLEPVKDFGKYDLNVSLKDPSGKLLVKDSGSPYGVKSHFEPDTGRFVIEEIEVPENLKGQKLGSYLRNQVIEQAKKRGAKGISSSQYGDTLDSRRMWETPEGNLRPGVVKSPYAVVDAKGGITTNDHGPAYWMDF